MTKDEQADRETVRQEQWRALRELEEWLETPMVFLGLLWLLLLTVELVSGGSPLFDVLGTVIWAVFIGDFLLRFILAPRKGAYLRHNALTAVSLLVPALRVFRAARAIRTLRLTRTARGLRLVRLVTSFRRGMGALGAAMQRRGLGYVVALTALVTLLGAAGMYAFEAFPATSPGFTSFAEALWWTAMLLTSLGSDYWPRTAEGRLLTVLLAIYGFAVFGYITAALASFFVGRDARSANSPSVDRRELEAIREEIAALRRELGRRAGGGPPGEG